MAWFMANVTSNPKHKSEKKNSGIMECWNDGIKERNQSIYSLTQYSNIPSFHSSFLSI
jgi:hypothetical protein